MIVLDAIDPTNKSASLREIPLNAGIGTRDYSEIDALLKTLGVDDLDIVKTVGAIQGTSVGLDHRWICYDDGLQYELGLPHRLDSGPLIATYSALALATYGRHGNGPLTQMRLAIYELCMNVLEHGRTRRGGARLRLSLLLSSWGLRGCVEDECEPFNPLSQPNHGLDTRFAMRAPRGYGIMIVQKLMDEVLYEYTGLGNRITFEKRIEE